MATAPASDGVLRPGDAIKLLEALLPAQTHSYLLGLKLGLPVHVVDGIFATHLLPRDRLLHVLIAFLNQEEPQPTWEVVVGALRSPAVNLPQLAKAVEAKYSPYPPRTHDDIPIPTSTSVADGTSILRPVTTTSAGKNSTSMVNHVQLQNHRPDSPIPDCVTSQYVQAKIKGFERRFNSMKRASRACLEKRKVSVQQVADALMDLPIDDMEEHRLFLESHVSVFYKSDNQSELFGALSFNMNYLSYQLLDYLVREFELEVKEEMESYKSDLKRFREVTPLLVFCQTQKKRYVDPPSRFVEVVAKFLWPEDISLEVVEQFRQEYACQYNLRECAMMLAEVRPGSFIVVWFIPECIAEKLISNVPKDVLERFSTAEFIVAGNCIYSTDDPQMKPDVEELGNRFSPDSEVERSAGYGVVSAMRKVSLCPENDSEDESSEDEDFHTTEDECLFVNKPNHELFCPVTTDLLLQPHLTSCCGKHLSQKAATRILKEGKSCPMCNAAEWYTMLNKHFQRQMNSLMVFCSYRDRGCRWQGELSQLALHISLCPSADAPLTTESGYYLTIIPSEPNAAANYLVLESSAKAEPTVEDGLQEMLDELSWQARERNMLVPKHHLNLGELVGQGETGLVYSGYMYGEFVAVKTSKALPSTESNKQLAKEASIMLSLIHPNVMPLIAISLDATVPLLIMPFMIHGTLLQHLRRHKGRLHHTEEDEGIEQVEWARTSCLDMCHQIAKGLTHVAQSGVVHRDVAARNCMIAAGGIVKVSDFGMAAEKDSEGFYRVEQGKKEKVPVKWMAPESIEDNIFTEKTDVWSFGVTCWEVFTCGAVPYPGVNPLNLQRELKLGHRLQKPYNTVCSDEIWSMLLWCWFEKPKDRPNFITIVEILFNLLDSDHAYINLIS